MTRLTRAIKTLRVWGPGFLKYFLFDYLTYVVLYSLTFHLARNQWRQLIWGVGGLIGVTAAIGVYLLAGLTVTVVLLIVLSVVASGVRWSAQSLQRGRMVRQARAMMAARRSAVDIDLFTSWSSWPVDASTRAAVEAARRSKPDAEIVLGRFDRDGRVSVHFGTLPGLQTTQPSDHDHQGRFILDIVLIDDSVLVRKDFRGNRKAFLREWHNLVCLQDRANVPAVHSVDEQRCVLYKNLVLGRTLRDLLVEKGAAILLSQTQDDAALQSLSPVERIEAVWARGRECLRYAVSDSFFDQLEEQIDIIHGQGVAKLSLTFGNVMVGATNGKPWLIDFENAVAYSSRRNFAFVRQRDQDRTKYNRIYARDILTEESARARILDGITCGDSWYAPIDFGYGLSTGRIWRIDSGTGRWKTINARVLPPLLKDKRVLDLGSNNGLMPILMLKNGAREVVGLEMSSEFVKQAELVHRLFEWRDMRRYNFTQYNCNMLEILHGDWGLFDVVTAYCSLYYLEKEDMAAVVRRVAQLAPMMIVQANSSTRAHAPDQKAEKSSVVFLKAVLEKNGFQRVDVFCPAHHPRPLLIGYRA